MHVATTIPGEPCDLTAVAARALIGAKRLSPVELVASCIARVEAVDYAVNAMPIRDFDRARAAARAAEQAVMRGEALGALHGLPIGIKDTEETEGLRSTFGSPIFADNIPAADDRSVACLRAAGGIVLGKTNVPEFAAGANTRNKVFGATGNPFDPARSAAGSSGGSAVALATNMVPLASGSDLGGSLRNPAAFCGIVGFRPSPGLVANEKRGLGWSPLAVNGPMARNVADLALMFSALVCDDARDPLAYTVHGRAVRSAGEFHPLPGIDLSRVRAALTADFGCVVVERIVRDAFAEKSGLLRDLFAVAEDTTPDCAGANESFAVLRGLSFLAGHLDKVRERPQDVGPNVRANVAEALRYTAEDVARAELAQTALYRRWQAFFERFDVLLTPAITISPRPWSELYPTHIDNVAMGSYFQWLGLAYVPTLTGHPALCLPVGRDAAGLPFGLQIIGPRGGDAKVLAVAAALEAALAGDARTARPVPDVAALRAAGPISAMPGFWELG